MARACFTTKPITRSTNCQPNDVPDRIFATAGFELRLTASYSLASFSIEVIELTMLLSTTGIFRLTRLLALCLLSVMPELSPAHAADRAQWWEATLERIRAIYQTDELKRHNYDVQWLADSSGYQPRQPAHDGHDHRSVVIDAASGQSRQLLDSERASLGDDPLRSPDGQYRIQYSQRDLVVRTLNDNTTSSNGLCSMSQAAAVTSMPLPTTGLDEPYTPFRSTVPENSNASPRRINPARTNTISRPMPAGRFIPIRISIRRR